MFTEMRSEEHRGIPLSAIEDPIAVLESIFADAPVAFQIYRLDGRCLVVNQAFRDLFGSDPPPGYNLLEDEVAKANGVQALFRRALAGETLPTPPIWHDPRRRDDERVAMTATFFPLRAKDDRVSHVAIAYEDITASQAYERRADFLLQTGRLLAESLDYEQTLARVARTAVPRFADFCLVDLLDSEGQVRRVAGAHADPAKEPLLDELRRRYPARGGSPQAAARAMVSGQPILHVEMNEALLQTYAVDPGHLALMRGLDIVSYLVMPLRVRGRTLGAISFGMSESRRRFGDDDVVFAEKLADRAALAIDNASLFAQTEAARHEAEDASRVKDEFLALLGHELRNPLAPIMTALSLIEMRRGQVDDESSPWPELEVVNRQVRHLARLVDDLLDVSRIRSGKVELRRSPVRLDDVVQKAVEMASPLLEQRNHRLTVEVPPLTLDGDEARLAQVFANLLTNAAKFTDPGGTIRVQASQCDGQAEVRVIDNGRGIDREMLPHVFDVFVQGRERREGGLGLGLALVRSLTSLHGGSVEAHSDGPGRGSELVVRLPVVGPQPMATAPPPPPPKEAGRRERILVVDDNEDAAELLSELLRSVGHEVQIAHDGVEALAVSARFHPEVAILDIGLPVMDGYELARRMREAQGAAVRLIAVTGYGQESDLRRSRAAGFERHFVKPVHVDELLSAIEA
jgi:signal transduction histidine kinase/CheY-like chemotaxis protein